MRTLILSVFLVPGLMAEALPDGQTLMTQVDSAMHNYSSIRLALDRTLEVTGPGERKVLTDHVVVTFVNPGKLRIESRGELINKLLVSDGSATWVHNFDTNNYWKVPAAMHLVSSVASMGLPMQPGAAITSMTPQTVGQEAVESGGQKRDCWIVQNAGDELLSDGFDLRDPVWTVWIDKKLGVIRQSTLSGGLESDDGVHLHLQGKAVAKTMEMDISIADSQFVFTPPAGAQAGLSASLKSEDDEFIEWDLRSDRSALSGFFLGSYAEGGKRVLLVFGTSSCQPCRQTMPVLERLYQEYKVQGLEIVQIYEEADESALDRLLKDSPVSYKVVFIDHGEYTGLMVSGYPTFVMLSQANKIVANDTGFAANMDDYGEAVLRSIIAQAGIGGSPNSDPRRRWPKTLKKKKIAKN